MCPRVFPEEIRSFATEAKGRVESAFDRIAQIAYLRSAADSK